MAENNDVPGNTSSGPDADEPTTVLGEAHDDTTIPTPPASVAPEPAQPAGPRLRDTVWNFRSMLLVALASFIIGGALGAALMAATNEDDGPDRVRITSFQGGPGDDMPPGMQGFGHHGQGPGMGNGQDFGGLTDEQRQKLEDQMQKRLEKFREKLDKLDEQAPTTPTPSPSTAG